MNRLEYLAHHGAPEQIIKEVSEELAEKDIEIKRLKATLIKIASCKCPTNLSDCQCVVCLAKRAVGGER